MYKRRIAVVIGSKSDFGQCARGLNELRRVHKEGLIDFVFLEVCSAHRNPDRLDVVIQKLISEKIDWIIAGAGGSNHLTGILDARMRNKYHDAHTVIIGVAFSGKTERKTLEALHSITGVPGFQGAFDEKRHVGMEGFLNACLDAISMPKPEIILVAPKPGVSFDLEKAYAMARNSNIPLLARHDDFIVEMEEAELWHEYSGKVRETFSNPMFPDLLYFYQTNRISIFDIVLNMRGIPYKGAVLTATTVSFLTTTLSDMPNHLVAYGSGIDEYLPEVLRGRRDLQEQLLVVKKTTPLAVEAICRGYLTGSGLKDYRNNHGVVCGIQLPKGLVDGSLLPESIFTPSTKALIGDHDINISFEDACQIVGQENADKIREMTLRAYGRVCNEMLSRGIVVADTKLEFGIDKDGNLIIIDETFTPDSSRYWPTDGVRAAIAEGKTPPSFDKQPVRNAGEAAGIKTTNPNWVPLPELITETTENYLKIASIKFGKSLERFQAEEMGIAS